MHYIPVNIKTGKRGSKITEEQKKSYQTEYLTKGKFTFEAVADPTPAKEPLEAKKAEPKPEQKTEAKA